MAATVQLFPIIEEEINKTTLHASALQAAKPSFH